MTYITTADLTIEALLVVILVATFVELTILLKKLLYEYSDENKIELDYLKDVNQAIIDSLMKAADIVVKDIKRREDARKTRYDIKKNTIGEPEDDETGDEASSDFGTD